MYKNKKVAVVVPAHNEEKFIGAVINRSPDYLDHIYVVDDCSRDNTANIVFKFATASHGRVCLLQHAQNGGVGKAITTGYKRCLEDGIDIAVVMGGDNQMDPAQLPRLLDPLVEGKADYAVGDRISSLKNMKGMSYWRRTGNWILRWLTRIASGNTHICDPQNGYAAINRRALIRLNLNHIYPRYGYCNDLLVRLSVARAKIVFVPMPAVYGSEKSQIRYWHYIPTVSWLLLKGFLWRINVQWFHHEDLKRSLSTTN